MHVLYAQDESEPFAGMTWASCCLHGPEPMYLIGVVILDRDIPRHVYSTIVHVFPSTIPIPSQS